MKYAGKIAFIVAILGAAGVALMLFGARFGLWDPTIGFGLYRNYFNSLGLGIAGVGLVVLVILACCRLCGHRDKVFMKQETLHDEKDVQPRV